MANQDALRDLVREEVKERVKKVIRNGVRAKREERKVSVDFVVDDAVRKIANELQEKLSSPSLSSEFTHLIQTGAYTTAERVHYDELVKDAQRLAQPAIEELQKILSEAIAEGAREAIYEVIDEILKEQANGQTP